MWSFAETHLCDDYLFPALQVVVLGAAALCWLRQAFAKWRAGRGPVAMRIKRSDASMAYLNAAFAAVSALVVGVVWTTDAAEQYRVLWTVLDALALFYVFLLNGWSRNHLLGLARKVAEIERR